MFNKRTSRPHKENLEFITQSKGGWSQCIQGKPADAECNVLSNCVGYACGRFNEIHNEVAGTTGMTYPRLYCNAEDFIERAKSAYPDLEITDIPYPGAILCWRKGKSGSGSDGAGHVAIVERVISNNEIITTESNYGGTAWLTKTRKNDNGRWGLGTAYTFRNFIVDPLVKEDCVPRTTERDKYSRQVEVFDDGQKLRVRVYPSLKAGILGYIENGLYEVLNVKEADGYTWIQIGEQAWIAQVTNKVFVYEAEAWVKPQPVAEDGTVNQIYISPDCFVRMREDSTTNSKFMSMAEADAFYNVLDIRMQEDYTWYNIGEHAWVAGVTGVVYKPKKSDPTVEELQEQILELSEAIAKGTEKITMLEEDNKVLSTKINAISEIVK